MARATPSPDSSSTPSAPGVTCTRIDFAASGLPEYADRPAFVIDHLFTADDCAHLLSFVPTTAAEGSWPGAALDETTTDTSYRNSGRIVHDDPALPSWVLSKVRPYLPHEIGTVDAHLHQRLRVRGTHPPQQQLQGDPAPGPPATVSRLRELRFLRYGPGHFFKRHADGTYISDDKSEVSYYTLQLYLNGGDSATLKGGATRFWPNPRLRRGARMDEDVYVDVEPRMGRVLIFSQSDLIHSGEEVRFGVKYNIRADVLYKEDPATTAESDVA